MRPGPVPLRAPLDVDLRVDQPAAQHPLPRRLRPAQHPQHTWGGRGRPPVVIWGIGGRIRSIRVAVRSTKVRIERKEVNRKKFGGEPEGARCRTERGTHAHDGRGRLPRPLPRDGGTHGAPQVSTGRKEAWRCKPVGVEGGGAGEEYGELGGRCGVGRPRPVGLLRWLRVCAPAGARRKRCDFFLTFLGRRRPRAVSELVEGGVDLQVTNARASLPARNARGGSQSSGWHRSEKGRNPRTRAL